MSEFRYASFMVRLWCEPQAASGEETAWHGELESVQSGQTWRFQGVDALLRLMVAQLAGPGPHTSDKEETS